ncbi:MAG TPA: tetratricopeptide repeat protein [Terriglobales bacterium]|nr:tetratricopeptide repeat protein [Terriglobales bacterium]
MHAATCMLALYTILAPLPQAQSPSSTGRATVQGIVRDSLHGPVAGADVHLQLNGDTQTLNALTDSNGGFKFSALREGGYSLRAEMSGKGKAAVSPLVLGQNETKTLDLALSTEELTFFDEPTFSVAGVTDTTSLGGHGPDTVVRTKDALAKATVSLSASSSSGSPLSAHSAEREDTLRAIVAREPQNFDANHRLGTLLFDEGKPREALPYLEQASRIQPGNYDNAYQLALACAGSGAYERARANLRALLTKRDNAELHHSLGDVAEKTGNPLAAVREYQRAAQLDASEQNLFDWGVELLMHHAPEPAAEVFSNAHRAFPHSVRILLGLGVAWFVQGSYDQAIQYLGEASDLNPHDPNPYLFLGKIQGVEASEPTAIAERLARFARLQPQNAFANYYHAVSLWKRRKGPEDAQTAAQVESLLEKAVALNPKLGEAHLQLGILYSERKDFPKAVAAYQQAVALNPHMEQAHYRLAQAYRLIGQNDKAQNELRFYERISEEKTAQVERERSEIKQFVYSLRGQPSTSRPQ